MIIIRHLRSQKKEFLEALEKEKNEEIPEVSS
jgi:hypothetical protein